MAKSVRSKWKKAQKRLRVADERKNLLKRVSGLNSKLKLVQKGGISKVPSEEPEKRFHFSQPTVNAKERMALTMTTKATGKSDPNAPHPTTFNYETLPDWMPAGGKSYSYADRDKLEAYQAEQQKKALLAAAAAADDNDNVGADAEDDDGPMEMTIGCNDDEHLTGKAFVSSKVSSDNKLKSMIHQKGSHSGAKKMPTEGGKKRLVSSTGVKKTK